MKMEMGRTARSCARSLQGKDRSTASLLSANDYVILHRPTTMIAKMLVRAGSCTRHAETRAGGIFRRPLALSYRRSSEKTAAGPQMRHAALVPERHCLFVMGQLDVAAGTKLAR